MPPQRPRTIPCSSCTRLFADKRAIDSHFNDVHRARPAPQTVPRDRGNISPAKSQPSGQKNPKPLQGIHSASEVTRTGITNSYDNAEPSSVPFQGSIYHHLMRASSTRPSREATRRWGNLISFVQESGKITDTSSPTRKTNTSPSLNWKRGSQPKQKRNHYLSKLEPNPAHYKGIDKVQNWGLCDKDCGWCGHCMDGHDI